MAVAVLCGMQWGDEGKGKLVDILARNLQYIVRYQGGNNAGHTIVTEGKKFIFHLLPSGVFHTHARCLLAAGMLIDPKVLLREIYELESAGISSSNIYISDRAHLIMPYHILLDSLKEDSLGENKIGTTRRGIGPAYMDKYERSGIRVVDLKSQERLKELIFRNVKSKNKIVQNVYGHHQLDAQAIYEEYAVYAKELNHRIVDTTQILHEAIEKGENILCEGAQATMLDIDHGSYPFVTSSSPGTAQAAAGTGIGLSHITQRVGVFKAYCTRVGAGPFPTELDNEIGEKIRTVGHEFGSTTGRPRRTGWLDLTALRYSVRLNDFTELALMKLDVLSGFNVIKVATGYKLNNKILSYVPADSYFYEKVEPVYEEFEGWRDDISSIRSFSALPMASQRYVQYLEGALGCPIRTISVGPDRQQTIRR